MRKSKNGNLKEVRITDRVAIYLLSKCSKKVRRSPTSVATLLVIKALQQYRPDGDSTPDNHHWQAENPPAGPVVETSDPAGAGQNAAAGQEGGRA
jgi:hypothetical protein